jgi:hypothetical protein
MRNSIASENCTAMLALRFRNSGRRQKQAQAVYFVIYFRVPNYVCGRTEETQKSKENMFHIHQLRDRVVNNPASLLTDHYTFPSTA